MKHHHETSTGGRHSHPAPSDGRPHRGHRPFDYGSLRLLVLSMIAEQPLHGYEIMKAIEERMGGGYSPSPGVIYPTLSWLEDMGYAAPEAEGTRKSYRITPEGMMFITANEAALADLTLLIGAPRGRHRAPEPILRSMDSLKRALRARFAGGSVDAAAIEAMAAAIDGAASAVGTTMSDTAEPAGLVRSTARVRTPKAAGYLAQLCKHFAHKIPASYEGNVGRVSFAKGDCRLSAEGDLLTLTVESADPEAIPMLQDVVARHLARFAFREELAIGWQPA